jgi:uncharacterized membrane protein
MHGLKILGGVGLGAGLMYVMDPDLGRRRRALLRDQAVRLGNKACAMADAAARDLSHRATGLMANLKSFFSGESDVSDYQLVERVRSGLGRCVSHPRSIEVSAQQGKVTLRGPILAHEVDELICGVSSVCGVKEVANQLELHKEPGNVPGLQGGTSRQGQMWELWQSNWTPGTRLMAATVGGGLIAFGATRRAPLACILGTLGLGLAVRGLSNLEMKRLLGIGAGRRAVDIQKTININRPVEEVFRFWRNFQNFPRFMSHLKEVRDLGNGRSHWVASGPAGMAMAWDAVITQLIPNQVIAWRSEPGSTVANAGVLRFQPAGRGTRVDIRLAYNPPAGALGHFAAMLFGADAKSAMDEDLMRLKSLLEEGKATGQTGPARREDLVGTHQ